MGTCTKFNYLVFWQIYLYVKMYLTTYKTFHKIFTLYNRDGTTCYADQDDDIIFEDFARLRLKGETEA